MSEAGRPVRILLLVFLLYLAAWPVWSVTQARFTGFAVGLAARLLPIVEYPAFTHRLDFDGSGLSVVAVAGEEPIGRWDDLRFPFYLPFVVLLIALFPGVPRRDRGLLIAGAVAVLLLVQVSLIVVVVQQIHHQFFADHGARWLSDGGVAVTTFYRRLVVHFGSQLFSAAALFLLFLRYGRIGRRRGQPPSTAPPPLGRRAVTIGAAAITLLALATLSGSLLRRPLLRHGPRHAPIQMTIGILHQRAGEPAEAARAFRTALQSDPDNPRTHNNLAVNLARLGDWQAARARFERAVELDPDLGEAYKGLGLTELHLGRPCAAVVALEAARQRLGAADPELGEPYLRSIRARCAETRQGPGSPAGSGLTREGGQGNKGPALQDGPEVSFFLSRRVGMNKGDLIEKIAKDARINKAEAGRAIDSLIDGVKRSLKRQERVSLVGFGTFTISKRKAREGRNPQTGEPIRIPARTVPKFLPGKELKKSIQ